MKINERILLSRFSMRAITLVESVNNALRHGFPRMNLRLLWELKIEREFKEQLHIITSFYTLPACMSEIPLIFFG